MTKRQRLSKLLLFLTFITFMSCYKRINIHEKNRCVELVKTYNPNEYEVNKSNGEKYKVGEELDSVFSRMCSNEMINDSVVRKSLILLLEKKYLYIIKNTENRNFFYIYNVSNWGGDEKYIHFAFNVISNVKFEKEVKYLDYLNIYKDVVCIDDIIEEMSNYKLTDEEMLIHNECLTTLPTNCHLKPN